MPEFHNHPARDREEAFCYCTCPRCHDRETDTCICPECEACRGGSDV